MIFLWNFNKNKRFSVIKSMKKSLISLAMATFALGLDSPALIGVPFAAIGAAALFILLCRERK